MGCLILVWGPRREGQQKHLAGANLRLTNEHPASPALGLCVLQMIGPEVLLLYVRRRGLKSSVIPPGLALISNLYL